MYEEILSEWNRCTRNIDIICHKCKKAGQYRNECLKAVTERSGKIKNQYTEQ